MIVKRLIQERNSLTTVRVKPRSFDQGRCKNEAFTLLATLPTVLYENRSSLFYMLWSAEQIREKLMNY